MGCFQQMFLVYCVICPQLNSQSIQPLGGRGLCMPVTVHLRQPAQHLSIFLSLGFTWSQESLLRRHADGPEEWGVNTPLNSPPLMGSGCSWIFAQASGPWRDDSDELSIHFLTSPRLAWAPVAHRNNQLGNAQFITCAMAHLTLPVPSFLLPGITSQINDLYPILSFASAFKGTQAKSSRCFCRFFLSYYFFTAPTYFGSNFLGANPVLVLRNPKATASCERSLRQEFWPKER